MIPLINSAPYLLLLTNYLLDHILVDHSLQVLVARIHPRADTPLKMADRAQPNNTLTVVILVRQFCTAESLHLEGIFLCGPSERAFISDLYSCKES